jgi:hypothetical protein
MSCWDRLQRAWQSQSCGTIETRVDQLLRVVRFERRAYLGIDIFLIAGSLCLGGLFLSSAFRDIQKEWPWLIAVASEVWVAGYIVFNRWRRRQAAAHFDETMLAHVERSIQETEHRMRQERFTFWWYLLPTALGCMVPFIFIFAAMDLPLLERLICLLITLGLFAVIFTFIHLVMKYLGRIGLKTVLKKLEMLQALRETLLNADE